MLSAGSAWRVLETEHTRLRQSLDAIRRVVDGGGWKHRGPQLVLLRRLLQELQQFEVETHRPKGVVLLGSVRGRSAEADRLLDVLDQEGRQCEQLLARALEQLASLEQGGPAEPAEIASLLLQHRESMLRQLDQEDTALRAYTSELLTPEEWSAVASSISRQVQKGRGRRAPPRN